MLARAGFLAKMAGNNLEALSMAKNRLTKQEIAKVLAAVRKNIRNADGRSKNTIFKDVAKEFGLTPSNVQFHYYADRRRRLKRGRKPGASRRGRKAAPRGGPARGSGQAIRALRAQASKHRRLAKKHEAIARRYERAAREVERIGA